MAVKSDSRSTSARAKRTARRAKSASKSWADHVERWLPGPVRAIVSRARKDDILFHSAALAFYATVSLVPLVLLVLAVVSLVLGDQRVQQLSREIGRVAPKELGADKLVTQIADTATRVSVVAFITGLWPATSYGAGLVRAFDELSPTKDRAHEGLRGRGLLLVILLPVFVLGALLGSYVGSQALGSSTLGRVVGGVLALVTGSLGGAAGLALIYRIFPPEHIGWRGVLKATAITAASLAVISLAFVLYLALGADFQEHYATSGLAAFVLLAVWLFLANVLILVGYKIALESRRG